MTELDKAGMNLVNESKISTDASIDQSADLFGGHNVESLSKFSQARRASASPSRREKKPQIIPNVDQIKVNDQIEEQPSESLSTRAETIPSLTAIDEKRAESYRIMKQWEETFLRQITEHRMICEGIANRTSKRAKLSLDGFASTIQFFDDRLAQETAIKKVLEKKLHCTGHATKRTQSESNTQCYWGLSDFFSEFDNYHLPDKQNIHTEMCNFLKEVLDKRIGNVQQTFCTKLVDQEDELRNLRNKINGFSKEVQNKITEYSQCWKDNNAHKQDVYVSELIILDIADRELESMRKLGAQTFVFWSEIQNMELKRYQILKDCMLSYLSKMIGMKRENKPVALSLIQKLEQFSPQEEVKRLYGFENLFTAAEKTAVKQLMGLSMSSELSLKNVYEYLSEINPEKPDKKPLVTQEWGALKQFSIFHSYKPVQIIVTIDNNLIVLDKLDTNFKKAEDVICLNDMSGIGVCRVDPMDLLKVELFTKKPGFIMDTTHKYIFKFHTEVQAKEFMDFFIQRRAAGLVQHIN